MRTGRLVFTAVLGFALAFSEAASAQSFFEALFGGIGSSNRSEQGLFGGGQALYPEQVPRGRFVPAQFRRQQVRFDTKEKPGTIVIDTRAHFLYFVLGNGRAVRYGVGVGRTGMGWKGTVTVGRKAEWPTWTPPAEMRAREARRGHRLPVSMKGGPNNPLGARALYLHKGGRDTLYRIHGTNEPWTIGLNVSSGCIRLVNDDVVDLYRRAAVGAKVVVM